jgi:hypothetical protein
MKKLTGFLFLLLMLPAIAQQSNNGRDIDKLIDKKLDFLSEKLLMSDKEYRDFSQEFRAFEKKQWELFQQKKKILQSLKGKGAAGMTDAEIKSKLNELRDIERRLFELKDNHFERVNRILPPRKSLAYYKYAFRFKKMLLERHRKHNGKHKPRK